MTAVVDTATPAVVRRTERRRPLRAGRVAAHVFLAATAVMWMAPLLWAIYTSLRPIEDTKLYGYFGIARDLNFSNFTQAWQQAEMFKYFINSLIIAVPAVLFTLLLASFVAFVVSRFSFRFNITLLIIFTASNLLPPQVLIAPLFHVYKRIPLPQWLSSSELVYDSHIGVIAINIAFQTGFCAFVLSNYMKTIPHELTEAALVDGASVWRQYWQVIMPLTRPALAALATLEFTWVYNDFFWALAFMSTGEKKPITAALANLRGVFFINNNLIAAGSLMAAVPTLIVFFALQKHFVSGLTLGANKG
jgi:multiple sugar transport system permease protein